MSRQGKGFPVDREGGTGRENLGIVNGFVFGSRSEFIGEDAIVDLRDGFKNLIGLVGETIDGMPGAGAGENGDGIIAQLDPASAFLITSMILPVDPDISARSLTS